MKSTVFTLANGKPISINFDRHKQRVEVIYQYRKVFSSENPALLGQGLSFSLGESQLQLKLVRTWLGEQMELIENGRLALAGALPAAQAWKAASDLLLVWAVLGVVQWLAVALADTVWQLSIVLFVITTLLGAGLLGIFAMISLVIEFSGFAIGLYAPLCLGWIVLISALRVAPNRSLLQIARVVLLVESAFLVLYVLVVLAQERNVRFLLVCLGAIPFFFNVLARIAQLRSLQKMESIYPHLRIREAARTDILDDLP